MSDSLNVTLVHNSDGTIDQAASEAAFSSTLSAHIADREMQDTLISEKVSELFEAFKGQAIPLPTVASMVAQKLNALPANFKTLSERVANFVRANSQGETAKDGSVERPNSYLIVSKGKGGGVAVRADRPVKADSK